MDIGILSKTLLGVRLRCVREKENDAVLLIECADQRTRMWNSNRNCAVQLNISFRLIIGRLSGSYFSHFPCEIQRWLRKSRKSNARQHEHTSVECDSKIEKI